MEITGLEAVRVLVRASREAVQSVGELERLAGRASEPVTPGNQWVLKFGRGLVAGVDWQAPPGPDQGLGWVAVDFGVFDRAEIPEEELCAVSLRGTAEDARQTLLANGERPQVATSNDATGGNVRWSLAAAGGRLKFTFAPHEEGGVDPAASCLVELRMFPGINPAGANLGAHYGAVAHE